MFSAFVFVLASHKK